MTPNFKPEDYEKAQEICLDALDRLAQGRIHEFSGLAAMLTVTMHATYAMAPSEETADELIAFARNMAERDWAEEKTAREQAPDNPIKNN